MEKRLNYVDWVKAIGIVLVCVGHFLPRGDTLKVLFYTFHVPIFIFISGFLTKCPKGFKDCLKRILRLIPRLFIPYTIWHVLSGWLYVKRDLRTVRDVWDTWLFFDGKTIWNDALWFVPLIFAVSVLFLLLCWATRGNKIVSLVSGCLALAAFVWMGKTQTPLVVFGHTNFLGGMNLFLYFGVFALGYTCRDLVRKVTEWKEQPYKNPLLYVSAAVFGALLILAEKLNHQDRISLLYFDYNNVTVFAVLAVGLTVSFVIACALLPRHPLAELLSKNSLFIMCSHYFFFQWWVRDAGIGSGPETIRIRWALAVMMLVLYVFICALAGAICKKLPKLSKALSFIGMQN